MPRKKTRHPLVGKWFHSFDAEGYVEWQGHVVSVVGDGIFLVQLYEWIAGMPGDQKVVPLAHMAQWTFYEDAEDMQRAYTDFHERRAEMRVARAVNE
jgi:hypothetical protein